MKNKESQTDIEARARDLFSSLDDLESIPTVTKLITVITEDFDHYQMIVKRVRNNAGDLLTNILNEYDLEGRR
jgi:hypothetical protein